MRDWEHADPPAIGVLARAFGLSAFERDLLLLCAGVEMESDLGDLCGRHTGKAQRGSPTFGLAMSVLPNPEWQALSPWAPLRRYRLIEMEPGHGLSAAPLRIDERVLHFLAGINCMDTRLDPILHRKAPALTLADEHAKQIDELAGTITEQGRASLALQMNGDDASAQEAVAAGIASRHGHALFVLRMEDSPAMGAEMEQFLALWSREARLLPAMLLLQWQSDTPTAQARALAERLPGPLLIASREPQKLYRMAWRVEVNKPEPTAQRRLWAEALALADSRLEDFTVASTPLDQAERGSSREHLADALDCMAEQFRLSAEMIIPIATSCATMHGPEPGAAAMEALAARLWSSCRSLARPQLDLLAQRMEPHAGWSDLVLPKAQFAVLKMLAEEARNRMTVYERWGFARRGRRGLGLSALFAGPSGTGKTLAAEVLAKELDLDLYRIDLSAVVSKYIGETEKNLKRVFDAAEQGGVVLLFDEAEALFGKRSEVKDSHDRYANIEVGYLLQRMESYQGVAILTTNVKSALDKAFQRRLRFTVEFPFPGMAERAAIWESAIPAETPTKGLVPERLAQLNMTGGSIRNIALNAAFLAAGEKQPLGMAHALEAARLEAAKEERPITDVETRGWV
jgi:hypothetical protein